MEAQDSLISIDPNDVPPTKDQVMAIARNVYGFEGLNAGRVTVKHFDPLVLEVEGFFSEEEVSARGEQVGTSGGGTLN